MSEYRYACASCSHEFTIMESVGAHARRTKPPTCPECGSEHTERIIEAASWRMVNDRVGSASTGYQTLRSKG